MDLQPLWMALCMDNWGNLAPRSIKRVGSKTHHLQKTAGADSTPWIPPVDESQITPGAHPNWDAVKHRDALPKASKMGLEFKTSMEKMQQHVGSRIVKSQVANWGNIVYAYVCDVWRIHDHYQHHYYDDSIWWHMMTSDVHMMVKWWWWWWW